MSHKTLRSLQPIPRAFREAPEPVTPQAEIGDAMRQKSREALAERYLAMSLWRVGAAFLCALLAGGMTLAGHFGSGWWLLPALPAIVVGLYFALKSQAILRQRDKLLASAWCSGSTGNRAAGNSSTGTPDGGSIPPADAPLSGAPPPSPTNETWKRSGERRGRQIVHGVARHS